MSLNVQSPSSPPSFVASHVNSSKPASHRGAAAHQELRYNSPMSPDSTYRKQPLPSGYSVRHRDRPSRRSAWSRPWSWTQLCSHVAILYCIGCYAATSPWSLWFWVVFVLTLILYFYVCMADTQYREMPLDLMNESFEPRSCEECGNFIGHLRVKHCHLCNKCVDEFDHHCRYLNSCISGRTYKAWATFVIGLLLLMIGACMGAIVELANHEEAPVLRSSACWLSAAVSCMLALFLSCLLLQHLYLVCQGLTTLEYVKSQDPGFPGLPPQGWRNSVQHDKCYSCDDELLMADPCEDKDEVCICSICQVDLAKAQVSFLTCEGCADEIKSVNVCIICRRIAGSYDRPVVTSRVSTLRREPPYVGGESEAGAMVSDLRMPSTQSSLVRKNTLTHRHSFSAILASVEGGTGDAGDNQVCGSVCGFGEEEEASDSGDESGENL